MEWIDTHAHLYLPQFDEDRDAVLDDAASKGIHRIYLPNIDLESRSGASTRETQVCYQLCARGHCERCDDKRAIRS